jgi:hypothetical protein
MAIPIANITIKVETNPNEFGRIQATTTQDAMPRVTKLQMYNSDFELSFLGIF